MGGKGTRGGAKKIPQSGELYKTRIILRSVDSTMTSVMTYANQYNQDRNITRAIKPKANKMVLAVSPRWKE
jgi:hypothetical protein